MGNKRRALMIAAGLVAATVAFTTGVGGAAEQKLETLQERMEAIQERLDASTQRIEDLRTRRDSLLLERAKTDLLIDRIERRQGSLAERVETIARDLYMGGDGAMIEVVLSSDDLGELASRLEYMSAVGDNNERLLAEHQRTEDQLDATVVELEGQVAQLTDVEETLASESASLQQLFIEATDEYEAYKEKLQAQALAEAAARRQVEGMSADGPPAGPGFRCPIDAPTSFIDSWGFPRSGGRTHEGTDIMAAMGAPVVAIADGRITYAGVGGLSGNWLVLTDEDGHEYMYMHNRENLITEGPVRAGQQIATVGDTGNAIGGPPHVHFEYHPFGGGPVNPFELLSSVC